MNRWLLASLVLVFVASATAAYILGYRHSNHTPQVDTTCRDQTYLISAGGQPEGMQFKTVCENGSVLSSWHQLDGWRMAVMCLCPMGHDPMEFHAPRPGTAARNNAPR
jgi:hypothetical protein